MIGAALILGLVSPVPDNSLPVGWRETVIRHDTARLIAADLPKQPRQFRFQCSLRQFDPKTARWSSPKCIHAGGEAISDPHIFAEQARIEAEQRDKTVEDRLRRIAWLRVMLLHDVDRPPVENFTTFFAEETVSTADLVVAPVARDKAEAADIVFKVKPRVTYPRKAASVYGEGRVDLNCIVVSGGRLQCETVTRYIFKPFINSAGDLLPSTEAQLIYAAHRAALVSRVAAKTRDGRQSEGLSFPLAIRFLIN